MAFVPGYKYDIFVSYADVDDEPHFSVNEGWVTTLVKELKISLARNLGRKDLSLWIDQQLARNVNITEEIMKSLRNTATLLVILSPGYIESDWCQRQKNTFLSMVRERVRAGSRVFVIEIEKLEKEERPVEFRELLGYPFWVEDRSGRYPRLSGIPEPQPNDQHYYTMLNDLSHDLANELKELRAHPKLLPSPNGRPAVFLADPSDDLRPLWENVKHYLEKQDLRVLPETFYSYEPRAFQETVRSNLARSELFVQLLSPVSGKKPFDLPQGYVRCQYELAQEMEKPIVQWRSPDLSIDSVQDSEHCQLLEGNTVRAVKIEEFREEIVKRVSGPGHRFSHVAQEQPEKRMKCFSWLHLTDLHRGMKQQHWLWPGVRDIFFEDLQKLHEKCGPWDLVLFTGDLTQQGSAEEFKKVNKLLKELWVHLKKLGPSPKLLVIPGNHDLVRPDKKDPTVRMLQQWEDYPDIQEEFWEDTESLYRQVVKEAFKNYTSWWRRQSFRAKGIKNGILPGDFAFTFEKDEAKLGIVGLNTSFLQLTDGDYKGRLALHARQFQKVCKGDGPKWVRQHYACLLLTHHPPDWLNPESQKQLRAEITAHGRFAVHLCGHMHEATSCDISEAGTEPRRIWQGRSTFGLEHFGEKEERQHGYTAGKIEFSENQGRLIFWPRKAHLQGGQWEFVPDYSLKLTDEQHTPSRDFELLQPFENGKVTEKTEKL